jgi:hypothetical protein
MKHRRSIEYGSPESDLASLRRDVQNLVARLHPDVTIDRRADARVALPVLLQLVPLDDEWQPIAAETITVAGKNISRRGISFYHDRPLPYRRAVISVAHPELGDFAAEIDLNWCRFTSPGWYESGGWLVRSLNTNAAEPGLACGGRV